MVFARRLLGRTMPTAPSSSWADDPDVLAARAASGGLPLQERQEAFLRLRPFIERQVQRRCVRFHGQTRQDLIDDAVATIWEALPHFEIGRAFEPWCRAVLKNNTLFP